MRPRRPRAALRRGALTLTIVAWASQAQAQGSEADQLFRQGRAAAKAGDPRLACARFEASLLLERTTGTLINLGDCEEKLGHWVRALSDLHQAAADLPTGDDRVAPVRDRIAYLETHLPRLTVRSRSPLLAGTRVFRDEAEIAEGALGVAIGVDPGTHRLRVVVAGAPDRVVDVHVAENEHREVWLDDIGGSAAGAPPTGVSPIERSPASPVGWIFMGAGGAALVTGAVTGLLTLDAKNTVSRECDADHACSQQGLDALRSGPTYSTVSMISFVAAATAGAIGIYLLLTQPPASNKSVGKRRFDPRVAWPGLGGTFE